VEDDWNLMDEDQLSSAFWNNTTTDESNKGASQNGMANAMQEIKESQNAPSGEPLSSTVRSLNREQLDAGVIQDGTESQIAEKENNDLTSLFGEDGDEAQDFQNGLEEGGLKAPFPAIETEGQETDTSSAENGLNKPPLLPAEAKEPKFLGVAPRPPISQLTLPKPSLLTFPRPPQQQQQQQQTHQQLVPQATFGPSQSPNLIPTPKRGPKAPSAPVLPQSMNQRCRERLDASRRHIRGFVQSQRGAAGLREVFLKTENNRGS
jgi:hypothetical protein